jgi:hypothetical protein
MGVGGPRSRGVGGRRDGRAGPWTVLPDRGSCFVNERRKGETMKRILAVLAMVVALSIPVAAHAANSPAGNSHGHCAPHCAGK